MNADDRWMQQRLEHYRKITPHPGTACHYCRSLATWREIDERGNPTPGTEWCYCSGCGRRLHGNVSPWREKAFEDWMATSFMCRNKRKWRAHNAYTRMRKVANFPRNYVVIEHGRPI